MDFASVPQPKKREKDFCPFCPGSEEKTPPEVLAYRSNGDAPNTGGWHVRVVPNKYPALQVEGDLAKEGHGLYDKSNGVGAHEVIIETPDHSKTLSTITEEGFEEVLWAFRDRIVDLKKDERLRYVLIFKNHGASAGATLEHGHSQLIALPVIPKRVSEELNGSLAYYRYRDRCIYCDILRQEAKDMERIVIEDRDFVAVTPYAPKSPFEVWILPKHHESNFENCEKNSFQGLSRIFSGILKRMDKVLDFPPYNFILHTAPLDESGLSHFHWHFEIIPKLVKTAGFEWGSGFYINPTPPEESAKFLREAKV